MQLLLYKKVLFGHDLPSIHCIPGFRFPSYISVPSGQKLLHILLVMNGLSSGHFVTQCIVCVSKAYVGTSHAFTHST